MAATILACILVAVAAVAVLFAVIARLVLAHDRKAALPSDRCRMEGEG